MTTPNRKKKTTPGVEPESSAQATKKHTEDLSAQATLNLSKRAKKIARVMEKSKLGEHVQDELRQLIHEMQARQIEMDRQDDELRKTRIALESLRSRYFDLYDLAPVGYVVLSEDGLVLEANHRAAALLGFAKGDLVNQPLNQYVLEEDREVILRSRRQLFARREPQTCRLRLARPGGSISWFELTMTPVQMEGGAFACGAVMADITAQVQSEGTLLAEKERAVNALQSIGEGIITTDGLGFVQEMNAVAEALLGYNATEARGRPIENIFSAFDEATRIAKAERVRAALRADGHSHSGRIAILARCDGDTIHLADSTAPMRDRRGRVVGTVTVLRDVSAQHRLGKALLFQASHDALTGLVNRAEFERRLARLLDRAKQFGREHALIYIDFDRFKTVNDTCGHGAGDELLRQLSRLLEARLRERDTLARLGGDEFGVLLGECSLAEALAIAQALQILVHNFRFVWQGTTFRVGASIGLVPITAQCADLSSLMSAADRACYVAKEQGRNRVHVYAAGDDEYAPSGEVSRIGDSN